MAQGMAGEMRPADGRVAVEGVDQLAQADAGYPLPSGLPPLLSALKSGSPNSSRITCTHQFK
jgi:hypothetical protein